MRVSVVCAVCAGLVLTACKGANETDSNAAVQAAIEAHLQQRQNVMLANMTLELQDVMFSGETADAEVRFRSKQRADLVVGVRYRLRKVGDGWQVESSSLTSGMGMSPHGSPGGPSPATPPSETPLQPSH